MGKVNPKLYKGTASGELNPLCAFYQAVYKDFI